MQSMYQTYATEGATNGEPNDHFYLYEEDARNAASEVLETHLNLRGNALESKLMPSSLLSGNVLMSTQKDSSISTACQFSLDNFVE